MHPQPALPRLSLPTAPLNPPPWLPTRLPRRGREVVTTMRRWPMEEGGVCGRADGSDGTDRGPLPAAREHRGHTWALDIYSVRARPKVPSSCPGCIAWCPAAAAGCIADEEKQREAFQCPSHTGRPRPAQPNPSTTRASTRNVRAQKKLGWPPGLPCGINNQSSCLCGVHAMDGWAGQALGLGSRRARVETRERAAGAWKKEAAAGQWQWNVGCTCTCPRTATGEHKLPHQGKSSPRPANGGCVHHAPTPNSPRQRCTLQPHEGSSPASASVSIAHGMPWHAMPWFCASGWLSAAAVANSGCRLRACRRALWAGWCLRGTEKPCQRNCVLIAFSHTKPSTESHASVKRTTREKRAHDPTPRPARSRRCAMLPETPEPTRHLAQGPQTIRARAAAKNSHSGARRSQGVGTSHNSTPDLWRIVISG